MVTYFLALLTIAAGCLGSAWLNSLPSSGFKVSMFMQAALTTVGGMAMIAMALLLAAMQMVEDYSKKDKPRGQ